MEPQTQAQIDGLIQFIENAEDPATVTNEIVAAVLKYFMNKAKEVDGLDIDSRINRLSSTLDTLVSRNAANTIESFNEVIEFLAGVTDDETLSGLLLSLRNDIEGKTQKAGDGRLKPQEAPVVMLDSMGSILDSVGSTTTVMYLVAQGDYIFSAGAIKYYKTYYGTGDPGNEVVILGPPQQGLVYCNKKTGLQYRWTGSDTGWVQVGGGRVINDLTTGGTIDALSAEQGKVLKAMIEGLDVNSDTRIGVVDTPSDTVLAAPSARMVKEIYLNLRALFDPTNGLAGIAFLKGKLDWQTVDAPDHTITLNLTEATAEYNGESKSGSFDAAEGEVTIKLTPATGKMILAENVSVMLGNDSVPFTISTDNGSVLVTFILSGDVAFTASALSGRSINFSGSTGCSINAAGVSVNQDLDANITANEHFTLPQSITVKIGNTNVAHTYAPAQDGKTATLHIDAANITGNLTIVCTAVEDDFAEVTFGTLTNVVIKRGDTQLVSGNHVYAGETISILPASGYKLTSATINNIALSNGDAYSGYTYQVLDTDVPAQGSSMAIVAAAAAVNSYNVAVPTGNNFTAALQGENGNAISSPVREGSTIKIAFTPEADYSVSISSVTMGSSSLDTDSSNDSYYTFANNILTIVNVQGAISVSALATEVGKVNVTYNLRNMVVSTDNTDNGKVNEGSAFEATLNAPLTTTINSVNLPLYGNNIVGSWSTPSVVVKKGGIDITETAYDSQTKQISIADVDADIEVIAICETKVFRDTKVTNGNKTWAKPRYPIAETSNPLRNMGVNSLYIKIPIGCSKIRWCHNSNKTGKLFNSYYFEMFTATKSGQATQWAYHYLDNQISIGGSANNPFPYNYTNCSFTAVSNNSVYVMAYFAQNYLSSCFLVDTTNVDETELQQADQAAVDAYNTEHGTNIQITDRVVGASLETIISLGGRIIFDGRYSALADLPS